jgi:DNA-binding transcriptional ArsR family regulator
MPRTCSICTNPKRKAIEKALKTESYRNISERFGLSKAAISRHLSTCVKKDQILETAKAAVAAEAPVAREDRSKTPNAYDDLAALKKTLEIILKNNKDKADQIWITLSVAKELRGVIETSLKVWEAQKRIEAQYNTSAPLSATIIYQVLREKWPKALKDVVAAIEEARN